MSIKAPNRPDPEQALRLLGLARRAGKLALGEAAVWASCDRKTACMVFLADDTAKHTAQKAQNHARASGIEWVVLPFDKMTLGRAFGREVSAVAALTDEGFAKAVRPHLVAEPEPSGVGSR